MNRKKTTPPAPAVGVQTSEAPPALTINYGEVSLDLIDPNPEQPRVHFDEAELTALADSIRENGVIQPIVIQTLNGRYILHDGERRLRAAKLAGLERIPANIILGSPNDGADAKTLLLRAIVANDQRADLSPIERARGYQKLADEHGLSDADIARQVGKSRSVIANTRRLLQLPEDRQAQVADGTLNERQALALLPLYQLPDAAREKVLTHWAGRDLAVPQKLTSDEIRSKLKSGIENVGKKIELVDPDAPFEAEGIYRPTCTGCDCVYKRVKEMGEDLYCLNADCLEAKQAIFQRTYLEQASAATGLPYHDPAIELSWHEYDGFYGTSGARTLELAREKSCPNLKLRFVSGSGPGPTEEFKHACYYCIHPSKRSCACAKAIEAQDKATENARNAEVNELRKRLRAHLVGVIRAAPVEVLRVTMYTEKRYSGDQKKILEMSLEKVAGELADFWIGYNIVFSTTKSLKAIRTEIDKWLAKMSLPALDTPAADPLPDLDRRLARIEGWIAELPDPARPEHLAAINGNLTNLAQLAEELTRLNAPELTARFDAAKRTLLARREQAGWRVTWAAELDSIRASLNKIADWLNEPEKHTSQKLSNRGAEIGDLAYVINTLIHKHGEQPEFTALMTEIETVEKLYLILGNKFRASAAPVELQPQEVAA